MTTTARRRPLLIALISCAQLLMVEGQSFARVCAISDTAPIFAVGSTQGSTEYTFVSVDLDGELDDHALYNNNSNRELPSMRFLDDDYLVSGQASNATTPRTFDSIMFVRRCPCALESFCHYELDACGVPADYSQPVGCFTQSTKKTLLRNAWPLLMLWYSTILFFLMCTEKGRNARNFIWLKLCNASLNERIVDRFLYTHGLISTNPFPDPSQSPLDWLPIARPVEPREPTELALKTRVYEGPAEGQDVEEEDQTCTICFAALEVGDRVGNLPCRHTFHAECLKEWLPRRNVCPLCQTSNAATPRYGDDETGNHAGESSTASEINDTDDNSNNTSDRREENAEGHVDMATLEMAVVEDPATRELRRPNPSFAQRLLAVSRI